MFLIHPTISYEYMKIQARIKRLRRKNCKYVWVMHQTKHVHHESTSTVHVRN